MMPPLPLYLQLHKEVQAGPILNQMSAPRLELFLYITAPGTHPPFPQGEVLCRMPSTMLNPLLHHPLVGSSDRSLKRQTQGYTTPQYLAL